MSNQYPPEELENDKLPASTKCWLQQTEGGEMTYLFQIEAASEGVLSKALRLIGGCVTANGFDSKKGSVIVITKKIFKTRGEFQLFRADCPLEIELT